MCIRDSCKSFEQLSKTYKAVFKCDALNERVVWYVSSLKEAKSMVRSHMTSLTGKNMDKRYRGVEYTLTMTEVFRSDLDTGYDLANSWGRD